MTSKRSCSHIPAAKSCLFQRPTFSRFVLTIAARLLGLGTGARLAALAGDAGRAALALGGVGAA